VSIGSSFTFVQGAPVVPTIGSSFTHTQGAPLVPSIGSSFTHLQGIPVPLQSYTSPTGDRALIPPVQVFGGTSGGAIPVARGPSFGGVSGERAAVPPTRNYSASAGGIAAVPPSWVFGGVSAGDSSQAFLPLRYFGGGAGGEVAYNRISPPRNLAATTVNAGCIRLDWIDSSPDEVGFRIERSISGIGDWSDIGTVDANVVTFLDRLAVPLVVYDYRVIAFKEGEESFPSNVATAVTQLPPDLPTSPPPVTPVDPPRDRIATDILEFKSPGSYGLEKDADGDIVGSKF